MSPLASGNWNNNANAGVFYRNWNNNRSNDNNEYGFRVARPDSVSILTFRRERLETKGACHPARQGEIRLAGRSSILGRKSAHA